MEITDILTNFGGMTACVGIMAYFLKYCMDTITNQMDSFREALEDNTLAITKLCERLDKE